MVDCRRSAGRMRLQNSFDLTGTQYESISLPTFRNKAHQDIHYVDGGPKSKHHSLPKNTTERCQDFQAREQRLLDQFESQRGQRELELQRIQQAAVSAGASRDFCRGWERVVWLDGF